MNNMKFVFNEMKKSVTIRDLIHHMKISELLSIFGTGAKWQDEAKFIIVLRDTMVASFVHVYEHTPLD